MTKTILIADDDADVRLSAAYLLAREPFHILEAETPAETLSTLKKHSVDLLLMDMNFTADTTSGQEGLSLLKQVSQQEPELAVAVMTAWSSIDLAVEAMKLGATDFIEKPWDNQRFQKTIQQQLSLTQLRQAHRHLKTLHAELQPRDDLIVQSDSMQRLMTKIERVAGTDASILLTGENGTGKSSLAKYIHACSQRKNGHLVTVNMGAVPDTLFESELFGHKRGAFTDAKDNRDGRFCLARGGTLFLDEISTIPPELQVKLLRVLETGEYERLGDNKTRTADARIISASNADFDALIEDQQFRQDLYYRLNTVILHVPALRERGNDVLLMAQHFLKTFSQSYQVAEPVLSDGAQEKLLSYDWPGNIRELSHTIERVVLFCNDSVIEAADIELPKSPAKQRSQAEPSSAPAPTDDALPLQSLASMEERHIRQALARTRNNSADAAKQLDISLSAFYRRLEKYGINVKSP